MAIITGGASGIGASVTQLFWDNGAKVVIADIQDNLGETLANKLHENACYMHCDVSKEEDIINLIDTTITKYGQLDIMYNNAGIMDRPFGGILDTPKSNLVRLLDINVVGSFLGAKHAARVMVPQRKGCILFTSSACTSIAGLSSHAYAVSKYGVWGLVRNLSAELGEYGIRVNCVSPYAVINTGISRGSINIGEAEIANMENWVSERGNLKGKILKVQDIANAALYLASDEANYVSGLNLVVDGGFSVVNPSLMVGH